MSSVEKMAADVQAPRINQAAGPGKPAINYIAVLDILVASSVVADLADAAQLGEDVGSYICTVTPDGGDVFFAFNDVNGGSVDDTQTAGLARCDKLLNGVSRDMQIGGLGNFTWLVAKATIACKLRIAITSQVH